MTSSKMSSFGHICCVQLTGSESVAVGTLRNYLDSCIFSISQTDSLTVDKAVRTFDVSARIRRIYTWKIWRFFERVVDVSCPGEPEECSGHGSCVKGECTCEEGLSSSSSSSSFLQCGRDDR